MKKILFYFALIFFAVNSSFCQSETSFGSIEFNDGEFRELENGLNFYILKSETEFVYIYAYMRAGRNCELENERGVSQIVFEALKRSGGKFYNSQKIKDLVNNKFIALDFYFDGEFVQISITALKKDVEESLSIIKDIFFNGNLTETTIEEAKNFLINFSSKEKETIYLKIKKELNKLLYGEKAFEVFDLSKIPFSKIDNQKVLSFYKKYYVPANCYLGIGSSIKTEKVEEMVQNIFSAIPFGKKEICPYPDKYDNESTVLILQKTGLPKSVIAVGKKLNISSTEKLIEDLPLVELIFAAVYSDSPYSRLIRQFKVERELSEEISFSYYLSNNPKKGYFVVFANPESKRTGFSLYIVGRVFSDLILKPLKDDELHMAKAALIGNVNYILSDPKMLLKNNLEFILRGMPPNYLKKYCQVIANATSSDIERIAKEYFSMGKYQYVIFGASENFYKEMEIFGKIYLKNASIDE